MVTLHDMIASKYEKFNYKFLPLVRDKDHLLCSLDILFLRHDDPGSVLQAGDLDNRIKTLIDALRAPNSSNELTELDKDPTEDDDPFYCLMWDDKQVSHITVETDTLLEPVQKVNAGQRNVRLIVTVDVRPYLVTARNINFAGS